MNERELSGGWTMIAKGPGYQFYIERREEKKIVHAKCELYTGGTFLAEMSDSDIIRRFLSDHYKARVQYDGLGQAHWFDPVYESRERWRAAYALKDRLEELLRAGVAV